MKLRTLFILALTSTSLLVNCRADITNGLVLYLPLDETTGTTFTDLSGNGNNGTAQNFTIDSQWTAGWITNGLNLNQGGVINQYILVPDNPTLNFTNQRTFTIAVWAKMPTAQIAGAAVIAKGTGGGGEQYDLDISASKYRIVVRSSSGTALTLSSAANIANNVWQHVVVVCDGTNAVNKTLKMYVNGQFSSAVTNNTVLAGLRFSANPVSIGSRQSASAGYNLPITNAILDEVRLYNRILTPNDVYELYALGGLGNTNGSLTITTQPRNVTNYVGDVAAFSVTPGGTSPFFYQWLSNGVTIAAATNSTLVLTNVQLSWSAAFSCVISNIIEVTNSATAYLQVRTLPLADIASGLVGYYKFDDAPGSTTAADSSGNGNAGSLVNFLDYNTCWVTGLTNGALNFNGSPSTSSSNLVAIPSIGTPAPPVLDFYASQALTVAAWVKALPGQTNGGAIIAKGTGNGGEQFAMDMNNGTYRLYVWGSNSVSYPVTTTASPNGSWQHLAAVVDAVNGIMAFYVNGQLYNVAVAPTSLKTNSHEISIGCRQSGTADYNLPFTGSIDDLHLYNRAMSSADVAALYAAGGLFPPSFTTQPQAALLYVGEDYTFSPVVNGTIPFKYQWRTNGVNLAGATNLTLVLTNVQLANAGSYSLFVSNAYGFTNSATAVLQVTNFYLTNMLAGWWKFDEGSGTTALDSSPNGNNGNLGNFPGDNSGWMLGRLGLSLNFVNSGAQEYVAVPDNPTLNFDTTLRFTLAAWLRGAAVQVSSGAVMCKGLASGGEQYCIDIQNGGYRFFCRPSSGAAATVVNPTTVPEDIPNGRWVHLAAVFDGAAGLMKMYLNGQLAGTATAPTSLWATTYEVDIGNRLSTAGAAAFPFTGEIDDVRIYSRALSATDVQALYASAGVLPPTVYSQPRSVTNYAHGAASFSVDADGTGPLSYQWLKNGGVIAGATTTLLSLTDLQITDAGNYSVRVTDTNSSALSSSATLAVLTLPPANLTNELIAYWAFDETNGTSAADSSGRGNSASLIEFPPTDAVWVPGVIGGALHFTNGGDVTYNNYRVGTDNPLALDSPDLFTFSFWAKLDPGPTGVNPRFITPIGSQHWVLWTPGTGVGFYVPAKSTEPSTNAWHHFVVLYNRPAGTYSLFVDGARQVTDAGGYVRNDPTSPGTAYWFIGHNENATLTSDTFTGLLDDVRIYNRLLNYNDIQALYLLGGAPQLSVTLNNRSLTVAWPVAATTYQLQSAGALTGAVWSNETATPLLSADGASQFLTFSADAQAERYYRLKQKP